MLLLILFLLTESLPFLKMLNYKKFNNVNSIILLIVEFIKFIWKPCYHYKKRKQEKKKKYVELILTEFLSHHSLKLNEDDKEKIENITIKLDEIERTLTI